MNKIDSNKLLLPSKNSAIQKRLDSSVLVPYKNIKLSSKKVSLKRKGEGEKGNDDELIKTVSSIKESLLKIEKLIENNSKLFKDRSKTYKKDRENENRKEKESKLETKKSSNEKFSGIKTPNLPRTGILDYIKNFLKWVIIGRAFVLFGKYLPKLLDFIKNLTPLYDFVKSITGALFNGLVTFIGWTDKAQKKLREIAGSLGGEPFQKAFDDFSGALTTFANLALIAGLATMGGSDLGLGDALDDISPDKPGKTPSSRKPKSPRITESGGKPAGKPRFRNPLRKRPRITASRPGFNLKNPFRQKPQLPAGGKTPRLPGGQPKITGGTPRLPAGGASGGTKLAAKTLLKSVRPLLRGMIIGGLIDFGLSVALGEDPGRAAFGAIGATLLGTIGGILGGPFAPFTAIGGGALGDWAGRKLYDAFFTGQKPSSKPQIAGGGMGGRRGGRKMQSGGSVETNTSKTYTPRRRRPSGNYIKKPMIVPPKKVDPGKNVGGEQKIKKLFPDTDPASLTVLDWINATDANGDPYTGTYQQYVEYRKRVFGKKPNPFKALTQTSDILKKIPVVGGLMGAGVDASLGQAFDTKKMLEQFKSSVGYVIDSISNQQIANLENNIKTFAEGGSISSSENIYNPTSSAELLEKILGPSIEKRVNEAISNIKKETEKKSTVRPGEDDDPNAPDGGGADTPGARLRDGSNAEIEADLLEYFTALYGKNAAIGIVANLRRESGYRTKTPDNKTFEGMAQWKRSNRWPRFVKWAESKGMDPYDRNAQAQYITVELKEYGTDKRLKQAKSPEEAAQLFYEEFEKGADTGNYSGSGTEQKHNDFIKDIIKRNPDIGKRPDQVLNLPTFQAKVPPDSFKPVTGTSGSSSLNPNVPLSVPYSPFTSSLGKPKISSAKGKRYHPKTGELKEHNGLDIEADAGTPIYAYIPGTVVFSGDSGGYGFRVEIKDSKGNIHSFSHLQSNPGFKKGQQIEQGQMIGKVGSTGLSTGPHLHWEIQNSSGGFQDPVVWTKNNPLPKPKPTQLSPQQRQNIQAALVKKGKIPFTVKGQDYFFEAIPNQPGKVKVFKSKNIFGYQEEVDITGGKNKFIADAINKKINTMYPTGPYQVVGTTPSQSPSQAPSPQSTQPSNPNIINASEIALSSYDEVLQNLKPGQKFVFDKVGSIQIGNDFWFGTPKRKYYNPSGDEISRDDFDKAFQSSEVIKQMRRNNMNLRNMQGGGQYLDMNYKNVNSSNKLNTLNTYDDEDPAVLIQPFIIIQKQSPKYVSSNISSKSFSTTFVRSSEYIP